MVGPVVTRMVDPSGLAFLTHLMPISPSPPVRFSTMMVAIEQFAGVLCHQSAQRVAAATGRERKDHFRQRTGLAKRRLRFREPYQAGASGKEISAVHVVAFRWLI